MNESLNYCRICLQINQTNVSLYLLVHDKYLPSIIETICGVMISCNDEPEAIICKECIESLIKAHNIIQKCQESHKILLQKRKQWQAIKVESTSDDENHWLTTAECKKETFLNVEQQEDVKNIEQNFFLRPEIIEDILDNSLNDQLDLEKSVVNECDDSKVCRGRSCLNIKDHKVLNTDKDINSLLSQNNCENLFTINDIRRPGIFRCIQCEAKPFINNQSLKKHIATIYKQSLQQNYLEETKMIEESSLENSWHGNPIQKQDHCNSDMRVTRELRDNKVRQRIPGLKVKDKQEVSACILEPTECKQEIDLGPEMLGESMLEDSWYDKTCNNKKTPVHECQKLLNSQEVPAVLPKHQQNPPKRYVRNYTKQPLKLIGDTGIVRKRKPKSHLKVIPNFYYRCELCNEFESNVAKYAKSHLMTVHKIERPAIFSCSQCDNKPFMHNQSLSEHIATVHDRLPRKREFKCKECDKAFTRISYLQRHIHFAHENGKSCESNNN